MNNTWKWILGIALVLALVGSVPLLWSLFLPFGGYGMMGYGHMPVMYGGFGMFGLGMILMWLIPLGLLVLIVLGIAWLVKQLTAPKN
jgi:hypothetical protein